MPRITNIITGPDKPILINFQNGTIQLNKNNFLQSSLFKSKRTNKNVIGVTNDDMVYIGEVNDDNFYNNFLVIEKNEGKELELIQVDTCMVTPLIKGKSPGKLSPVKEHSLAELHKQFGSKKAKRYTEQQERLTMNIENVKEHLEKTVADINISPITPTTLTFESESLYRPKINRNATSQEDVYHLADLVPMEILDGLEERVSEILQADNLKKFNLISTVENSICVLKSSSLPEKTLKDKCKIVLYVHYLACFMSTPMKQLTKNFSICDCSSLVDKYIKQNYMVNRSRPLSMKDKGVCFIIVLLMIAMNYEIDIEILSKDTKTGLKKMKDFARNLGFSPSSSSKSGIVLKIPVPAEVRPILKRKRNSI